MAITKPYLEKSPFRAELIARYTELANYASLAGPFQKGKHFFSFRNTGLQNQDVLFISDSIKDEGKVFLDVNTLSKDGTVSIDSYSFSDDGTLFAYSLGSGGSDWKTVHFKDVGKGTDLNDKLEKVKFSNLGWSKDGKGIFYAAFLDQKGKADGSENDANKNQKIYYHLLGTEQSKDLLIAEFPDNPDYFVDSNVSDCGKYLVVQVNQGGNNNLIYIADISKEITAKPQLKPIVTKMEKNYYFVANNENQFIFQTNKDADNYRLITIDITNPDPSAWKDLIPEDKKFSMEWASAVHDNYLVLGYIEDVKSVLQLHNIKTGEMIKKFPLEVGTVGGVSGDRNTPHMFFNFVSFLTPGITYHCDLSKASFDLEVINEIKLKDFDREKFTVEQIFYPSKDGTKVPMYCVHKKDLKKSGNNFAFMTAYGSYGISSMPSFSITRLVVVGNFDGIHCVANIRGGGEYGEKWHQAGSLENKQHSYDDFQAGAQYLINEKYTTNKLLAINGGSSGGLMMGVCLNQRPDLFGVVVADVPTMDLLRFDKFTGGRAFATEYGLPSDPKMFPIIRKYSPLHNIHIPEASNQQYPATMLTTSDHDDRVPPLHSLKFIATLQYEAKKRPNQQNPLVLKVDTNAGHGGDKPLQKQIADRVDMMCFIVKNTGIQFHPFVSQ
ncbi:prolyl endopeptidase-like [Planococcus citri]|uniref:prolyl endopeptidase-like n=1 Tax=Planococcus citri TaxID=170843 RepID=UPI0031FA3B1A